MNYAGVAPGPLPEAGTTILSIFACESDCRNKGRRSPAAIVPAMDEIRANVVNGDQRRPRRNENHHEEQAEDYEGLHLGKAETAIIMLLPVIMVMKGQDHTEKEA